MARTPDRPATDRSALAAPGRVPTAEMAARQPARRPMVPTAAAGVPSPPDETQPPGVSSGSVIIPKQLSKQHRSDDIPRAKLIYTSIEGVEAEFELEDTNSIGRHPKNSIRLHDREVSKYHAIIELRGGVFWLRDLNSSNGTFVNNKRISESKLTDGDTLAFGSMRLSFRVGRGMEALSTNSAKDLVTILPQEQPGATHIHAKLGGAAEEEDFQPAGQIADVDTLRRDYEKLRVAYELSRQGITQDFATLLTRTLDMAFQLLPADNGVILLVEPETGVLVPHTVKRREGSNPDEEIVLSTSIINQVIHDRSSILLSDAILDPRFSGSQSIISQGIRSAMCVPLVAHDVVYGVMHLDSRQRIGAFSEKDLQLMRALAGQAAVAIANSRLLRKVEDDARTRGQLSRFLPPHVVEQMVAGRGAHISKGGREVSASVLFCDIRGFTSLSEAASGPQEIVDLLNDYFERLVEVVFARHGVVDKYIGDALMAHWGTLEHDKDPTFNAVAAALDFRDTIREFNRERALDGKPPIGMGVGVNTGPLVAAYMGAKRRLEYTVIGDTVNTASRLCGLAEADTVMISEQTYQLVADRIEGRYVGTKHVKGKEQGVETYQALSIREHARAQTGS
jgi:adenylate cyclase